MKSKASEEALKNLCLSIGDFIRYWGFRRVHGAIWTQLYLSKTPLSCTQLASRIQFSKALISPALAELETWKLIYRVASGDEKTILYEADGDVNAVIKHVLKIREQKMMDKIVKNFDQFKNQPSALDLVKDNRLAALETMISSAQVMLQLMLTEPEVIGIAAKF